MKHRGFSLVELVTVLALVSILGAVAFARFANVSTYQSVIFQQELLSYFRLAQRVAVAHQGGDTVFSLQQTGATWQVTLQFDGQTRIDTLDGEEAVTFRLGGFTGSLSGGTLYRAAYNDEGDLTQVTSPANTPVTQSIQLTAGVHNICVAPTGFAYDGNCL
jgi:MSHA pilin protein MshC